MKRIICVITGLLVCLLASCDQCTTSDEKELSARDIVARCAEAMGGPEQIDGLRTMKISSRYPDHGDFTIVFEIQRPGSSMAWGGKLVFDGERACFLKGQDGNSEAALVPEEEYIDYPVEIAFYIPAFFDYDATYAGTEIIDLRTYHKLVVTLPLGAEMTYLIDGQTWLPFRASAHFTIGDKEVNPYHDLFDYREVDGILLPHGFTYGSRYGQIKGWITQYELNVEFPENYFSLPEQFSGE